MVQLKGLGVENLRLLEGVGIHSIFALSAEDPDLLYKKMEQTFQGNPLLKKEKIKIWIKEAQKVIGQ